MKLLLDTHAAIWWHSDDPRLSKAAADAIGDRRNVIVLSAVVAWEVAVKEAIGKLRVSSSLLDDWLRAGARELPVLCGHARAVRDLPLLHQDPFDRLLVVQARAENATILTQDASISAYEVATLW